jgi:hypothetical protein
MNPPGGEIDRLLRRLAGRRLARSAILFGTRLAGLWPPLGVAGVFICRTTRPARLLPPWWHIGLSITARW